ncbi:MAG: hypothetical protein AAF385_03955, partial [Pseudomonadota bacterium]
PTASSRFVSLAMDASRAASNLENVLSKKSCDAHPKFCDNDSEGPFTTDAEPTQNAYASTTQK